jgi:hypothetical protein
MLCEFVGRMAMHRRTVYESSLNSRIASRAALAWAMTSNNAMQPTAASELAVPFVAALLGGG